MNHRPVLDSYSRWAGHCDSTVAEARALAEQIVAVAGCARALDVGSGLGGLVLELLARGIDAVGVDSAPAAVAQANALAPNRFREGSILDLPFDDGAFGTVVSTATLDRLPEADVDVALQEIWRVCGGTLFVKVATTGGQDDRQSLTPKPREWWENRMFAAGFRKHPLAQAVVSYEALQIERGVAAIVMEKIPAEVCWRYSLADLRREPDRYMDMTREAGRGSDAQIAWYLLAARHIRPGDTVLEAACGVGYGAHVLARSTGAARTIGVDSSPSAIAYAAANFAGDGGRPSFQVADVGDLSCLPDRSVDAIVSMKSLEHLRDRPEALAEARRVLRPSGRIIESVPNREADAPFRDPNRRRLRVSGPISLHFTWVRMSFRARLATLRRRTRRLAEIARSEGIASCVRQAAVHLVGLSVQARLATLRRRTRRLAEIARSEGIASCVRQAAVHLVGLSVQARLATLRRRTRRLAEIARSEGVASCVRAAVHHMERRYFPYRLVRQRLRPAATHTSFEKLFGDTTQVVDAAASRPQGHLVAMLVDAFTDGGMERVTIDLCRSLRNRGYVPVILVATKAGRSAEEARRHGLPVEEFAGNPARVAAWLGGARPCVVLTHHCYFELQQFKAAGVPIVEVLHNAYFWQVGEAYVDRQRRDNVDALVAVSDFVRDYAVRHLAVPAGKITTIQNGLDIAGLVRPPMDLLAARRLQTLDAPVLAFVANLHPQKNHRGVIQGFARVLQRFPEAKLKIAGTLEGNEALRRRIEADVRSLDLRRSVEFLGPLNRSELSRLLAEAHVGLLPTHVEGFSIVTLEYAFFALPSVLSDTGAAPWLAREYGHALLAGGCAVAPERLDVAAIESGIDSGERAGSQQIADAVLDQLENYPAWLQRARKAAEGLSAYSIEAVADRYETLIEALVERGGANSAEGTASGCGNRRSVSDRS